MPGERRLHESTVLHRPITRAPLAHLLGRRRGLVVLALGLTLLLLLIAALLLVFAAFLVLLVVGWSRHELSVFSDEGEKDRREA